MAPKRALRLMKFPTALTLRHRGGAFAAANAAAAARSAASRTRADSAAARFFFSDLTRLRSARLLARALSASRDAFASLGPRHHDSRGFAAADLPLLHVTSSGAGVAVEDTTSEKTPTRGRRGPSFPVTVTV